MVIKVEVKDSVKLDCETSIFVDFPYNQSIVDVVRGMSPRHWHKDEKVWELPLKRLPKLYKQLNQHEFKITGDFKDLKEETQMPNIPGFEFKTEPYQHQLEGFQYGMTHDKFLLADEQGLGKTKMVIDIAVAKKLLYGYKHCLIICGVNGLKWNWFEEIKIHSNESAYLIGQRYDKRGNLKVGSGEDKYTDLVNIEDINDYFLILNVEALRDEKLLPKLLEVTKNGHIQMIAVDEIHKCKNPSSQQGKGLLKLEAETMIAMTGTPILNRPLELYVPLKWLGVEKHAFYAFKKHYCIMGGYGGYEVIGYRNMDELQDQLQDTQLRRLKKDVLDLPPKIRVTDYVEMGKKQKKLYKDIRDDLIKELDRVKLTNNPLAQMIRLRQATASSSILTTAFNESAKLDRMEELVDDFIDNGQKVIIYSQWTSVTDEVRRRLSKNKISYAVITGQTSSEINHTFEKKFQEDPNCMVCIGTIGALGTGFTLTAATAEIFLDEPWNMKEKEQAEDRAHRIGTTEPLTIITLLTKDTIDERINELVYKKGMMADMMVDGQIDMSNPEVIDYLLN